MHPSSVHHLFIDAGWFPGRSVDSTAPSDHPSSAFLRQYGNLSVGVAGAGEQCARGRITFGRIHSVDDVISELQDEIGSVLVHFANGDDDSNFYSDELGRIFGTDDIAGGLYFFGHSFEEAMERILLGRRATPILLSSQEEIAFYGETLKRGSPMILPLASLKV